MLFLFRFFLFVLNLLAEDPHADDAGFIKHHKRHGQQKLREHIGRSEDSGNHEGTDNHIGAHVHELFDVSQPQTVEYHHENRHLKRDAEGKEHA